MDQDSKIDAILHFVRTNPQSTASRTILRRNFPGSVYFETSQELGIKLEKKLKKNEEDEIDFCYYLIK